MAVNKTELISVLSGKIILTKPLAIDTDGTVWWLRSHRQTVVKWHSGITDKPSKSDRVSHLSWPVSNQLQIAELLNFSPLVLSLHNTNINSADENHGTASLNVKQLPLTIKFARETISRELWAH